MQSLVRVNYGRIARRQLRVSTRTRFEKSYYLIHNTIRDWCCCYCRRFFRSHSILPPSHSHSRAARVVDNGSAVEILFSDDHPSNKHPHTHTHATATSLFHAPWLWQNDPAQLHPSSGQRTRSMTTFFMGWKITDCRLVSDSPFSPPPPIGSLHSTAADIYYNNSQPPIIEASTRQDSFLLITWYNRSTKETLQSYYCLDWLYDCRYDRAAMNQRWQRSQVTCHQDILGKDQPPKQFDMKELEQQHGDTKFDILHAIVQDGAVLLRNVPASLKEEETAERTMSSVLPVRPHHNQQQHTAVAQLAHWLAGGTSHGQLYGDTFDVVTKVHANNIAYTNTFLPPHQDLAYYQSPPGLQLLHCVSNADTVVGGESTLIDAMAAANTFREMAPELFETLTRVSATWIKQRNNADMVYRGPHITVDPGSEQVVSVRWSPPFEGPLIGDALHVSDYFLAKCAMELMLDDAIAQEPAMDVLDPTLQHSLREYAKQYTWEQRLAAGDVLIFNNQRMLHGRRGFQLTNSARDGDRHLIGCYSNMEETLNQYRLLRRERMQRVVANKSRAFDTLLRFHRQLGNGSSGGIL